LIGMKKKNLGLIYVFTGEGKGKTSAALGMAVRAICAGMKVAWVAWYKEPSWPISEKKLPQLLPIDFYLMGKGFYIKKSKIKNQKSKIQIKNKKVAYLKSGGMAVDKMTKAEHKKAAKKALEKAKEILSSQKYDLLVCDEINNAVVDKLLTIREVGDLLKMRKKSYLILTGRKAAKEIINMADLVSEIKKIKHPFDKGVKAVRGLDF